MSRLSFRRASTAMLAFAVTIAAVPLRSPAPARADASACTAPSANAVPIAQPTPKAVVLPDGTIPTGDVEVVVTIDATGAVTAAHARTGRDVLRAPAEEVVRQTSFAPGSRNCTAVGGTYVYVVRYSGPNVPGVAPIPSRSAPCTQTDLPARVVHAATPETPEAARVRQIDGAVHLDIALDEDGAVTDVRVLDGPDVFRAAAIDAARRSVFATAVRACTAVPSHYTFAVEWQKSP